MKQRDVKFVDMTHFLDTEITHFINRTPMSNILITVAVAVAIVAAAAMVVAVVVAFNGHTLERNSISQYNVTIDGVFREFRTVQLWSISRFIMEFILCTRPI
jgi:hypothetical protein